MQVFDAPQQTKLLTNPVSSRQRHTIVSFSSVDRFATCVSECACSDFALAVWRRGHRCGLEAGIRFKLEVWLARAGFNLLV